MLPQKSLSVLVVDDDPSHRNLVGTILREAGYTVDEAKDGIEVVEIVKTKKFSVIVLNLIMPTFDGFRLIDYLYAMYPEMLRTIVVLSGFPNARKKLETRPVFGVMEKPFKRIELLETVRQCAGQ